MAADATALAEATEQSQQIAQSAQLALYDAERGRVRSAEQHVAVIAALAKDLAISASVLARMRAAQEVAA